MKRFYDLILIFILLLVASCGRNDNNDKNSEVANNNAYNCSLDFINTYDSINFAEDMIKKYINTSNPDENKLITYSWQMQGFCHKLFDNDNYINMNCKIPEKNLWVSAQDQREKCDFIEEALKSRN